MEEQKVPDYAPGQELTLHPVDMQHVPAYPDQADEAARPGPVTEDDPNLTSTPANLKGEDDHKVSLVAVFEDIGGAKACADDLERQGIETAMLFRRGDGPEQGLQPGNVITGPGYGLSAEDQSPPRNAPMGAGVTVGATLGATIGLITATFVIPPFGTLMATGSLLGTLTGAGIGSFLGGLVEYGMAEKEEDDASLYSGQVRRGGVVLIVRADPGQVDEVRKDIDLWSPLEIRVQ